MGLMVSNSIRIQNAQKNIQAAEADLANTVGDYRKDALVEATLANAEAMLALVEVIAGKGAQEAVPNPAMTSQHGDDDVAELLQRRGALIHFSEDEHGKEWWYADVFISGPRIKLSGKGETIVEAIQSALLHE